LPTVILTALKFADHDINVPAYTSLPLEAFSERLYHEVNLQQHSGLYQTTLL